MSINTLDNKIELKPLTDEDHIRNFLLDIDCLDDLSKWIDKFNIFDVLKISKTEIRHSNMLAWLLDPSADHGFGDKVLRQLFKWITKTSSFKNNKLYSVLLDCENFEIEREWHNIDILIVSNVDKVVICIENKIDSTEHDDQLNRYMSIVDEHFVDYEKIFLYLTPDGDVASDEDNWCAISYANIYEFVSKTLKNITIADNKKVLIENYLDIIRRDIMTNEEIVAISQKIYRKHQKALDIIFENRPDEAYEVAEYIRYELYDLMKTNNNILFEDLFKGKRYIRFNTQCLNTYLPPNKNGNSVWNTKDNYYYEFDTCFVKEKKKLNLALVLSVVNTDDKLRENQNKILNVLHAKPTVTKKYKTVVSKTFDLKEDMNLEKQIKNIIVETTKWIEKKEKEIMNNL